MSSINALLNHEGAAPGRRESLSQQQYTTQTTTYEAADALTTLATLGSGQQYAPAPTRELPSPTAFSSNAPRRSSSFGSHHSHHAPVEPSPPIDQPHAHSPTLDHYHQGSNSPEEQKRRQSLLTSPAPVLAPIQDLSSALQDQTENPPKSSSATPIGHDVSQLVPDLGDTGKDSTQDREPAFVRDEPHTSQIREPEPTVKDEPSGTPREATPAQTVEPQNSTGHAIDADTLKAIEAAKASDLGLRAKRTASVAESVTSPSESKAVPAPSKKRPAPSSSSAVKKKGTAKTTKPSNKKRKIDEDDTKARSVTPTSRPATSKSGKKGSQAGTPALQSSPAPEDDGYGHGEDDGDSSEDHNLYCICKKPDNHKWMIGCDGGCDDWFHGDCVNMKQADENLVDKFICPACEEAGKGNTTWKPMCRREGCRKPARLLKDHTSKYCSDECGVLFMQEQLQRTAGAKAKDKPKKKKKVVRPEDEGEEEEPTPLGGVLRAKDLKALVDASPNIQAFKNLGSGVLSPPHTASPTRPNFPSNPDDVALTAAETERLNALHNEKSQLNDRLEVLKDREKFVSMAKEQATRVADREKMKLKEFCGYDARLSWSDAEFLLWRNSRHGRAAFQFSTLSPTAEQISSMEASSPNDVLGDVEVQESVCLKKRCAKHPQWQKLNLQDARFEELEVVEAIKECEKEERSVRERARRRNAKDIMAKEFTAGDGREEVRNREGWVEVVAT